MTVLGANDSGASPLIANAQHTINGLAGHSRRCDAPGPGPMAREAPEEAQVKPGEVLALALEIARKVVHQTIAVKPRIILDVIREALLQMPLQHAMIHLNTEDAALVRAHAGEQLAHAGHRIQDDPQLARGDVVIDTGGAHLNARLATRWQNVIATLGQDTPWLEADETGHS